MDFKERLVTLFWKLPLLSPTQRLTQPRPNIPDFSYHKLKGYLWIATFIASTCAQTFSSYNNDSYMYFILTSTA